MKSLKFKPIVYFLFLLFFTAPLMLTAQREAQLCGIYKKKQQPKIEEGVEYLIDRFGNIYTEEELQSGLNTGPDIAALNSCTGGIFNLNFGGGFTTDERATICEVFQYLSTLVSLGPNGVSPTIKVRKEALATGVLGTGSPYFRGLCRGSELEIQRMMFGVFPQNINGEAGYLKISNAFDWHTTAEDPFVGGAFDLYTVALHEGLHILGFASLIGADGGPNGNFYSPWDEFLFNTDINQSLLTNTLEVAVLDCCKKLELNAQLSFPDDVDDGCGNNIFFNAGNNLAQVNANYPSATLDDNLVGNILSHLDCSGQVYVMQGSVSINETRRVLTTAEVDILAALGYVMPGISTCNIMAEDDHVNIGANNEILFSEILANDIFPPDGTIEIIPNCGDAWDTDANINIQQNSITITNLPIGTFELCYQINGCNGDCTIADIQLYNYPQLEECEDCEEGQLFCYGSFDEFIVGVGKGINGELGLSICPRENGVRNSPDVFEQDGNIFMRMANGFFDFREFIHVPLTPPLEVGCNVTVCLDAVSLDCLYPATIDVVGSPNAPCTSEGEILCDTDPLNCIGSALITNCTNSNNSGTSVIGDLNMQQYCFTAVNNSAEIWDYVIITRTPDPGGVMYFDNLDITTDCCIDDPVCECPPDAIDIDAGAGATYIEDLHLEETYTDVTLCISGQLILDDYIEWHNVEVIMAPGSEIVIIGDDAELEIYNSTIYACEAMWQGFVVGEKGVLLLHDSEVRDAQFAIHALDEARIELLNTVFDRNFVGVYTEPASSYQFFKPENSSIDWNNNTFKCDGDLLPAYGPNQLPAPGNKSYAGIWWNDVKSISVFEVGEVNYFEGSLFGIILERTESVKVRSVEIKNLINSSNTYSNGNIAIKLVDCEDGLRITDTQLGSCADGSASCTENLAIGIEGENVGGKIRANKISASDIGIVLFDGVDKEIRLEDYDANGLSNTITARTGILIDNYTNLGNEEIYLQLNTINAQRAIDVNNTNSYIMIREGTCKIDLNLWSGNVASGIRLLNSDGEINVRYNELSFTNFPTNATFGAGVELFNTQNCYFKKNIINGAGANSLEAGFSIIDSKNNAYCCNTVTQSQIGVHFQGDCDATNFRTTIFGVHQTGLRLTNAIIGDQINAGNDWSSATTTWDALYDDGGNTADLNESEFTTELGLLSGGLNKISVVGGNAANWFTFSGDDSDCGYDCDIEELPWELTGGSNNTVYRNGAPSESTLYNGRARDIAVPSPTVQVFPNPAKEKVNLHFSQALESDSRLVIFDLRGQALLVQNLSAGQIIHSVETSALLTGIYFYQIELEDKQILTSGKIVIAQ